MRDQANTVFAFFVIFCSNRFLATGLFLSLSPMGEVAESDEAAVWAKSLVLELA